MAKSEQGSDNSHAKSVATWLDDRFTIPGTKIKFGIDPIIGLIPGAGDWFSGMISTYFIMLGIQADLSPAVLLRMGFNIILDIFIGSIPLLGDIFDFGWKANTRNAKLLGEYQANSTKTEKHSRWLLWLIGVIIVVLVIFLLGLITWLIGQVLEVIF